MATKGRKHSVFLSGVSSLEGIKAAALEAAVRALGLSVVEAFEACEDPSVAAESKISRVLDLDAATGHVRRIMDLTREEALTCLGTLRGEADAVHANLVQHGQAALDALVAQRQVPYDPRTTVRAAENMLKVLEDTMQLLQVSDRYVIVRLHRMAQDATAVIGELSASPSAPYAKLADLAQQYSVVVPTLVTSLERRADVMEDSAVRESILQAAGEIKQGAAALLEAMKTTSSAPGGVAEAAAPLLDAVRRADELVGRIHTFHASFKTEYYGTDLDVALKQISDAACLGDPAMLAKAAHAAYADVQKALGAQNVPPYLAEQIKSALGDVLRAARACIDAKSGAESRAAAAELQRAVEVLNGLMGALPAKSAVHFVEERTDLLDAARLLMKKGLPVLVQQLQQQQ
eukprot:m51a1_g6888 hypothetical protein (404) ;mRNA; f:612-2209